METPALLTVKYAPYFIQSGIIKAVKPLYQNELWGILFDVDLCLLIEVRKQNGSTYDYQLNIRGSYKKDSSGRISGWSSAFKIQRLFNNLSAVGIINSDGSIAGKSLEQLIGKEVFVLNYISGTKEDGRLKYATSCDNARLAEDDDFDTYFCEVAYNISLTPPCFQGGLFFAITSDNRSRVSAMVLLNLFRLAWVMSSTCC